MRELFRQIVYSTSFSASNTTAGPQSPRFRRRLKIFPLDPKNLSMRAPLSPGHHALPCFGFTKVPSIHGRRVLSKTTPVNAPSHPLLTSQSGSQRTEDTSLNQPCGPCPFAREGELSPAHTTKKTTNQAHHLELYNSFSVT
ncbi:hypothetical protein VTK26DRAFT_8457 [Humicola hyalothermophila]